MGSIGNKMTVTTEDIKSPLIFGTAMIRSATKEFSGTVDIDGYSNKKTLKGALNDLAKAVEKYNKTEADGLRDVIKSNEIVAYPPGPNYDGGYILEWEEVTGATRYNEHAEIEYKDAKWYLHTRFAK